LPGRVRLVVTSPPYLRVVRYGACNWLRLWLLGLCAADVDATLDHAHRPPAYLRFLREVLADLRKVLADDAVVVLVLGDVESDGGHRLRSEIGLAGRVWEGAAEPEGYRLAGIAPEEIAAHRKSTRIWGAEAGRATRTDRLLVVAPTELGRRRALAGAALPVDWSWPPPPRPRLLSAQGSR
jgi:site-specific DNA-methyltransferase (adenine-specific)